MRVLVTGGYGLIGSAVMARLQRDGHEVVCAGRNLEELQRGVPFARRIEADFSRLLRSEDWVPLLEGIEAVVNCVGALQDGPRDDLKRIEIGTIALFAACERLGIRGVIHVSAIGARLAGPTEFARSKARIDDDLAARDLDWVILRPGLVIAPGVYGGTAMLRGIAALPWRIVMVEPEALVQVIAIDDLTETVARCLVPNAPRQVRWDVADPQVFRLCEIVFAMRLWLGLPPRPIFGLPRLIAAVVAFAADALGHLGWRSPARSTAMAQLVEGVVGDPAPWMAATGIKPKSLGGLTDRPSTVQDRWFARLYLLKPLAIFGLAMFWFATGLVAMGPGRESAVAQFAATGFSVKTAELVVLLGAGFDVVLGALLLFRRFARQVLIVMFVSTLGYLLAGSILAPQLWIDPLGPLTKVIPLLVATLLTLAIMDDR